MNNFIDFLHIVNRKTRGGFYIFLAIIMWLIISAISFFTEFLVMVPSDIENDPIFGQFFVHILFMGFFLISTVFVLWLVIQPIKWVKNVLIRAIKEAAIEKYGYNVKNRSKVVFK